MFYDIPNLAKIVLETADMLPLVFDIIRAGVEALIWTQLVRKSWKSFCNILVEHESSRRMINSCGPHEIYSVQQPWI
jgi:hypothetical protein